MTPPMPQSELKIAYKWIVRAAHRGDLEAIELLTGYDAHDFQAMGVSDPVKWFEQVVYSIKFKTLHSIFTISSRKNYYRWRIKRF